MKVVLYSIFSGFSSHVCVTALILIREYIQVDCERKESFYLSSAMQKIHISCMIRVVIKDCNFFFFVKRFVLKARNGIAFDVYFTLFLKFSLNRFCILFVSFLYSILQQMTEFCGFFVAQLSVAWMWVTDQPPNQFDVPSSLQFQTEKRHF